MKTLKIIPILILFNVNSSWSQQSSLFAEFEIKTDSKIFPSFPDSNFTSSLLTPPCSPSAANDNCASATVLNAGGTAVRGTMCNSTTQSGEPNLFCGSSIFTNSVWYSFQATSTDMYVDINQLSGACFISVAVYGGYATSTSGCIPSATQRIACFGAVSPIEKILRLSNLTVNGWYMIQVGVDGGSCGSNGNYTFNIHVNTLQTCTACSANCGSARQYSSAPSNYQQLKNDGACYPMRHPNDTIQKHYTFSASETSVSFNAGWYATGGCSGFASVSFSLYDNCGLVAANSNGNFSGLTISAPYTINYNLRMSSPCNVDTLCPFFVLPVPLPVELLYFTAETEHKKVICRWATAGENGSDYFQVERSLGGISWQSIAKVKAAGNSSQEKKYIIIDEDAPTGELFYRLLQTDKNGKTTYSSMVSVQLDSPENTFIGFNPGNHILSVRISEADNSAWLFVHDAIGRRVYAQSIVPDITTSADLSEYNPGLYIASVLYNDKNFYSKKIIVKP